MELAIDELASAQAQIAAKKDTPPAVETPKVDPPPAVTTQTTTTEPPVTSSLTADQQAAVTTAPITEPPVVKSFEQYLEETSKGKFKKWDEVEAIINTPREEFANDNIKHWNELAKKGIDLNKEFFELQNLNLEGNADGTIDPEYVITEAMRRKPEYKNLSHKTLQTEINKKYNVKNWIDKPEEELTDEDLANREIMMRDAHNDLDFLTKYKEERTFISQPNEEQQRQQREQQQFAIQAFEKLVDEDLFAKVTDYSAEIEIDKEKGLKEVFQYKFSEADRKRNADLMKLLPLDLGVLVNRFIETDEKGNKTMNHRKVYEMLLKADTFDEVARNSFKDGIAVGAKNFVKDDLKNANFTPADAPTGNPVAKTEQEAQMLAIKAAGKSFN